MIDGYIKKIKKILKIDKKKVERKAPPPKQDNLYYTEPLDKTQQKYKKRNKLFSSKLKFYSQVDKKNRYVILYLSVFFIVAMIGYLFVYSSYFLIKDIDISREDSLVDIDIIRNQVQKYKNRPIFKINKLDMMQEIISHEPSIEKVIITKNMPDSISIVAKSFDVVFGFKLSEESYIITSNGVIVKSNYDENTREINIVGLDSNDILDYNNTIIKKRYLDDIINIIELINFSNSFIDIENIVYYLDEAEVHIITTNNTRIIFDIYETNSNEGIETQIEKLNIFYDKYIDRVNLGIVYIDLRIGEKILYCPSSNEAQCMRNIERVYGEI